MKKTMMHKLIVMMLLLANAGWSGGAWASDKLSARIQMVEKLLSESTAAKQIETSGSPEALATRDVARAHFEAARFAQKAGDDDTANTELSLATREMMQAVRLSDQVGVVREKKITDFRNRESSINTLLEAYERVLQENGTTADGEELHKLVEKNLKQARLLVDQGRVDEGRQLLDETYAVTKMAVDKIRDGETLIRSLNFANKEEEYHYELDRNDTHLMLVRVLLSEKMNDARISKQVTPFLEEADSLRKRAEKEAGGGNYKGAVVTLEESTRQVTRAIRMAGIYIPG